MEKPLLTTEWEVVSCTDTEARLLEVFKILFSNLDEYEEPKKAI
jgi:hypothetical protein